MTAPVVPRVRVAAPSGAAPHRYGLFTAAAVTEGVEGRELTGVEYESVWAPRVDPYPAACVPNDTTPRVKDGRPTLQSGWGTPFAVYAADTCWLGRDEADLRANLRTRLQLGEEAAVESAVFGGAVANFPNLLAADVLAGGDPVELVDAVGVLEQWLAGMTGSVGVIHAPMWLATRAHWLTLFTPRGQRAETVLGSTMVFGAGYPGLPPTQWLADENNTDDGAVWLYATGQVSVRRSAIVTPGSLGQSIDRTTNEAFLLAERSYVVDWPGVAAAVRTRVARDPGTSGGAPAGLISWFTGDGPPGVINGAEPGDMYYDEQGGALHQLQ